MVCPVPLALSLTRSSRVRCHSTGKPLRSPKSINCSCRTRSSRKINRLGDGLHERRPITRGQGHWHQRRALERGPTRRAPGAPSDIPSPQQRSSVVLPTAIITCIHIRLLARSWIIVWIGALNVTSSACVPASVAYKLTDALQSTTRVAQTSHPTFSRAPIKWAERIPRRDGQSNCEAWKHQLQDLSWGRDSSRQARSSDAVIADDAGESGRETEAKKQRRCGRRPCVYVLYSTDSTPYSVLRTYHG